MKKNQKLTRNIQQFPKKFIDLLHKINILSKKDNNLPTKFYILSNNMKKTGKKTSHKN